MDGLNPCPDLKHDILSIAKRARRVGLSRIFASLLAFGSSGHVLLAQTTTPVAPPPAPPIVTQSALPFEPTLPAGGQLYSIGDPTNEEQLYLELINRARANPTAEGLRLATTTDPNVLSAYSSFGVNLVLMQSQFGVIPPAPPLSLNATLTAAARAHSQNCDCISTRFTPKLL